jgi:CHAD domain-containing protein
MKALGSVRDVDVQLAFLTHALESQPAASGAAFEPVRARLAAQHSRAHARLLKSLDSPPVQAWLRQWRDELTTPGPATARAQRGITAIIARDLIRERMRSLRKQARRLGDDSAAEDFHRMRIRAKRLRYVLDAFAGLYGDEAQACQRALAKLQTVLGDFQDSSVREQRFAELVVRGPRLPPATTFMVGRLVERDAQDLRDVLRRTSKAWRRVRRRWRALASIMKSQAESAMPAAAPAPPAPPAGIPGQ